MLDRVAARRRSSSRIVAVLCCAAALLPWSARGETRLYQWNDARTGTTQLSGRAPAWYRKAGADPITQPRVLVFENGRLIDDSHRRLPEDMQAVLREQAFTSTAETPNEETVPTDAAAIERLRAIVRDFDQRQTEQARSILQATPAGR